MILRYASLFSVSAVLSGCSVGLTPGGNYPTTTFNVDVPYQEAYRRAEASLRQCHASSNPLMRAKHINGTLYTDNHTGTIRVTMDGWGNDMERVEFSESGTGSTKVAITVWEGAMFDAGEVAAVRRSIETGVPACREPKYNNPI
jgi:hypothetical protein